MSALMLGVILFVAALIGVWRKESERLDASCDDAERNYDPDYNPDREPPSV